MTSHLDGDARALVQKMVDEKRRALAAKANPAVSLKKILDTAAANDNLQPRARAHKPSAPSTHSATSRSANTATRPANAGPRPATAPRAANNAARPSSARPSATTRQSTARRSTAPVARPASARGAKAASKKPSGAKPPVGPAVAANVAHIPVSRAADDDPTHGWATDEPSADGARPATAPRPQRQSLTSTETIRAARERARKLRQEAIENEMQECTFRPSINPASNKYGLDGTFFERSRRWDREREAELESRRRDANQREVEECTFRPALAPRPATPGGRPTASAGSLASAAIESGMSVVERLFDPQAAQAIEAARRRQREAIEADKQQECTFQPRLLPPSRVNAASTDVSSRYRETPCAPRRARTDATEVPFTPRTNPLPASLSEEAASYLNQTAHERLARTSRAETPRRARRRASFGGPVATPGLRRSSSVPRMRRPRASGESAAGSDSGGDEPFNRFFERQRSYSEKRRALEEAARAEADAQMRGPELSAGTARIMARDALRPSFLARMEGDVQKYLAGSASAPHSSSRAAPDEECTFTPQINARARGRRGRSVEELSVGDTARRERDLEKLRLERQQEEEGELTFRPRLNTNYSVESRLKVTSDPTSYMARVKQHMQLKKKVVEVVREAQETKLLEECTFQPRTTEVPAYISKIARSMAQAKSSRQSTTVAEAPGWR